MGDLAKLAVTMNWNSASEICKFPVGILQNHNSTHI